MNDKICIHVSNRGFLYVAVVWQVFIFCQFPMWRVKQFMCCRSDPIVGNPWVILIDSLFHHPWVHLMTFTCFPSNVHNLCDLFLPNEITCYVCMLLFYFGGALFKPTWQNQHVLLWNIMKIPAFLQLLYSWWLR